MHRLLCVALLLAAATATAQRPPPECPEGSLALNFRDADLTDVIQLIAEESGRNFLYDDRVRGRVTVVSPTCITRAEAYRVFESILQVKGFTTVEGPGQMLRIVPVREAKESPIETLPEARSVPNRDLFITRLIPLRFIKADTIANTLRPLVSKDANMVAYAPTNTIILTDSAANVRRLLALIAQIDVETYQEQIKVLPVEFADASTLAGQLREIFGQGDTTPVRTRRPTRARPRQAAATPAAEAVFGEAGEPRFITDERTNSIIVIAPRGTIERVERVVKLLDYKRHGSGRIHVYRLQNADSEEMAQTLSSLAGGPTPGAAPGQAAQPQGGAVADLEEGVRVTADAPTNSLIIQASSEGFAALRDVIEALDVRRPQVMVEALIMEVNVDDNTNLGVGWLFQGTVSGENDTRIAVGSNTGVPSSTFSASTVAGGISSAILGKTVTVQDLSDGALPGDTVEVPVIQGILTATATDDDTEIISAPVILTADNEEAQLTVGENIPVPVSRLQAATGAADSLSTSASIERRDVGVTLRVTPQISEGDTVRLQIFQEISQVDPEAEDPNGPTTLQRTVENTVYVKDGEAVMIGGIIQERTSESIAKVPWLGDIPILGWAFKSRLDETDKVNLLIILTPHIVRDPDDLQQLTVEQREQFRHAAGEALARSDEELEARRRAVQAGVELPPDDSPVRRELEMHQSRYPVEELPELRGRQRERELERKAEMEREKALEGGEYVVQVSLFREPDDAVGLLERLMTEGYDGTVFSRVESGELYHFVQLGPYANADRAQQVAREVAASTGLEALVIVEP